MSSKTVRVTLDKDSIDNAVAELLRFRNKIQEGTLAFVETLAETGVKEAKANFESAEYDGTAKIDVSFTEPSDYVKTVEATGDAVLFVEFGTGVVYPDDHPEKPPDVSGRGEYGKGHGSSSDGWYYPSENGLGSNGSYKIRPSGKVDDKWVHTYGNPANACMYNARKHLEEIFMEKAKEIYDQYD